MERRRRQMLRWWRGAAERCGPASGLRALFDLVAMPLFGMLGYRARDAVFEPGQVRARLVTRSGANVGLVLVPWASRPPGIWRDLFHVSRDLGAHVVLRAGAAVRLARGRSRTSDTAQPRLRIAGGARRRKLSVFLDSDARRVVRAWQPASARSRRPARRQSTRSSTWRAATRIVSGMTCSMAW